MAALDDLASKLFGSKRAESNIVSTDATTRTYVGTATSASEDGSVYVALSQDVTLPDDDDGEHGLGVEMPTTVAVDEGDEVLVTVFGGGVMKAPVVTGNPGWGDNVQVQVDNAEELATEAQDVAQKAAEEVEQVRQDVADFRDDVATTYATKVERQDGDDAVRTFITTNYTNSNDLATTYATKTLVSQTKDAIELSASQTYETQSDAAATYATKAALTVGLDGVRTEVAEDYQPKGDYATTASMNSAIQQSASSIESSVAATYTTKAEFEGLQVGATNLAKGTSATTEISGTLASTGAAYLDFCQYTITRVEGATEYVASFEAYASAACVVNCYWYSPNTTTKASSSTGQSSTGTDGWCQVTLTTEWKRYWVKWTQSDSAATDKKLILCRIPRPSSGSLTVHVRAVKMETGNIPTDWSPAPEDIAATYATKTEVQQTAAGLDTRITTAQSTADGAYLERSGTGTTIDTTGAATIRSLVVEGQSVQDGTPTPDAPVPIVSVESYQPNGCVTLVAGDSRTDIDLQGHALRSLPDGTHDEMRVDSLGRVTLTKRIESYTINASSLTALYTVNGRECTISTPSGFSSVTGKVLLCDRAVVKSRVSELTVGTVYKNPANVLLVGDTDSTIDDLREMYGGATVLYPLATPQTIDLGTIDLPAPADTLWLDAALVPTMGATWWTVGGIAGQQALDAEVTERQTLIRQFSGGVLAGYVGNAIAALVNAAGSFDVVRTAWSGGVPSILGTLARYAASGISLFDAAGNVLAEFASDHVRIGGDVPIGDATTGGEASVQFFDQTSTHASSMDASTYIDEQAAGGGYGAYYDMRNEVGITTSLDDDGRVVDTDSSGTASMQLTQEMSYGITATDEQHNEVIAALVADASYSNGTAVSHAAVRATASTTGGSDLSYAELIADAIGIGTNEGSIDYVVMRQVICALLHPCATYTAAVGTWTTGTANAWQTAGFGVVVTESGFFTDYINVANKGVGEFTALVGCTVRVAACVTWVDSVAGRRSVGAFVNATRSGDSLSGGTEYSNSGLFYTGSNAKTAQLTPVVLHLAAGNRLNIGKYAPANAVQSNQAYKMNWVTIEVIAVD